MRAPRGGTRPKRYLLDLHHPEGESKALFFFGHGYRSKRPQRLIWDLRRVAQEGEVRGTVSSEYGTRHVVEDEVTGPSGRPFRITTVWMIRKGEDRPRLVTAYPAGKRSDR